MRLVNIKINNFRGIKHCDLNLPEQAVLVGDNNIGKSTILEAIDLVLGPERLSRRSVIDEHDFYAGQYLNSEGKPVEIIVEAVIAELNEEQVLRFRNNLEYWDYRTSTLVTESPEATDDPNATKCLRVRFEGKYDAEEDDFVGDTYFSSPVEEGNLPDRFTARNKRFCGFLYLRTLRTGSRALSLERGSLLDIILRLKELKLHMWEDVLNQLRELPVATNPELDVSKVLDSVQESLKKLVTKENADAPTIRVSQLTREHLRQVLTVFLDTGAVDDGGRKYAAPFHHQGTGTINILVLSLLSMIAELKQNVIFAMEEPEIAIPPHTQKRIIDSIIGNSAQAIFTSHSPYVLEEFKPEQIIVVNRNSDGNLTGTPTKLPSKIQHKLYKYRDDLKRRFCEALLARRVLIVEGQTEYLTFSRIARKLAEENREIYSSFESLGIAVICAEGDSQLVEIGLCFRALGKETYAIFDKQNDENSQKIAASIDYPFESTESGFEQLVLNETSEDRLRAYAKKLGMIYGIPEFLTPFDPFAVDINELKERLFEYLKKTKADGTIADLLEPCVENEMPTYITETLKAIRDTVIPVAAPADETTEIDDDESSEE